MHAHALGGVAGEEVAVRRDAVLPLPRGGRHGGGSGGSNGGGGGGVCHSVVGVVLVFDEPLGVLRHHDEPKVGQEKVDHALAVALKRNACVKSRKGYREERLGYAPFVESRWG